MWRKRKEPKLLWKNSILVDIIRVKSKDNSTQAGYSRKYVKKKKKKKKQPWRKIIGGKSREKKKKDIQKKT